MELLCFCVFDKAAGAFLAPWFVASEGLAKRSFVAACRDPSHDFSRYSGDFSLHSLGRFETDTGVFHAVAGAPPCVMTGVQAQSVGGDV